MKVNRFEDLEIWQLSIEASTKVYKITQNEKFRKDYGLSDQVRRAVVSVSSNIAEGFERNNNNEFIHYLKIAKGSAGEVRSQLLIAFKLEYLTSDGYNEISAFLLLLSSKIGKFIKYLTTVRKNDEFKTR